MLNNFDLEQQRLESLELDFGEGAFGVNVSEVLSPYEVTAKYGTANTLFGTLEIEAVGSFYVFLTQKKSVNTWVLTERNVFDVSTRDEANQTIVAVLQAKHTGRLDGYGKTYLLTRLMSNISTMVYMCINNGGITVGYINKGEYVNEQANSSVKFFTTGTSGTYLSLDMSYEGFKLSLSIYSKKLPVTIPVLSPVQDNKSKAAIVANLGVKTAKSLFQRMGKRLDWYKSKKYTLIDTDEKFDSMMLSFLRAVQRASERSKSVLVGLDTETTGLNMLNLTPDNSFRDHVVSIPFAWEDHKAFVICVDMYYFDNVDPSKVYPLFDKLFSRNPDFTFQDIDIDFCGEHFHFNRQNITVAGWNASFDEMAFMTEGCHVFFDEDGRQIFFNLDTDLIQGKEGQEEWGSFFISNSLKMQTRRLFGIETLELEELFGKGNEDKYRYLQDEELALLYGGADADFTRLCVKRGIKMTESNLYKQYRKYDMPIMYMMAQASWNGMPIAVDEVRKQGDLVFQDLERIKDFIYHYAWLANRDTIQSKADKIQELLGLDNQTDVESVLEKDKMFRYPFTPANHKKLLFKMLGYPVIKTAAKTGQPALDKYVLKKLMDVQRDQPVEVLLEDLVSIADPSVKLVDKDKFNRDTYPLARVFSTYATLNKEYTSYYRPIMDNDMEGKMFYNITMARAATRRILSPGQTMKGSLKSLVIAPPGKLFMSFDASQIEYRHMASLAYIRTKKLLIAKHPDDWQDRLAKTPIAGVHSMMQKEEADYHIETAASMTGVRQHEVTPKVRKQYKSIGFGIPYGLGDRRMCENIHGVVNEVTLRETRDLLSDYKIKQHEIIELLESTRDNAFKPAVISDDYRKYLAVGDHHVGIVRNFVGFYRVFILEDLTRSRTGRIRRQAGNCIIQGGAAELFRRMLYNFQVGCCKVGIQDKIQWLMTVHDELDAIVDANIDIMLLIKVLYENCTLRYEDHIPYYIGINFGANWADAKDDANELPVIMVERMIKAYDAGIFSIPSDGNQVYNLLVLKRHYMCDRVTEELLKIFPSISKGHIWTQEEADIVDDKFENYVVRAYIDVFSKSNLSLKEKLQGWQRAREEYGFGVNFLQTELITISEELDEESLLDSLELELNSDLFDNTSEEVELFEKDGVWFDETSMFDQKLSGSDILVSSEESEYYVKSLHEGNDSLIENDNPTNAFDVYVSSRYLRTKVLRMQDGVFSVLTNGTSYVNREKDLQSLIKGRFSEGSDTILIVGSSVLKISGLACTEEDLDWLDKKMNNA